MFIFGIFQIYLLFNVGDYYTQLRINLIKKITNPDQVHKMESDGIIQYFNLASHLFILIGLLTSFWYIYLGLILLVTLGNYIEDKYKSTSESLNSNNSKGNQIVKYIKRSKIMTYFVITIKTVVLFGLSLMYFHGYI
jgi:hypothetical protein